jgi:hypothetical protein
MSMGGSRVSRIRGRPESPVSSLNRPGSDQAGDRGCDEAEVSLLNALAEPGELKVLKHPLTKRGSHVLVLSQRVMRQPLRKTLRRDPEGCQEVGKK